MKRYSLELRSGDAPPAAWRDGKYTDLVAARCDAIVEANNLAAAGAPADTAIEIHDEDGRLVSTIALVDLRRE